MEDSNALLQWKSY